MALMVLTSPVHVVGWSHWQTNRRPRSTSGQEVVPCTSFRRGQSSPSQTASPDMTVDYFSWMSGLIHLITIDRSSENVSISVVLYICNQANAPLLICRHTPMSAVPSLFHPQTAPPAHTVHRTSMNKHNRVKSMK
jgi:hypothetical protein